MIESTPSRNRVTGFYRGKVLAHSDHGKCKIYWPGVTPFTLEECWKDSSILPDSEQAAPIFMRGSSSDKFRSNGLYSYPEIGTNVWGFFANEDVNYPVYFATSILEDTANSEQFNEVKNGEKGIFNLNTSQGQFVVRINVGEDWFSIEHPALDNSAAERAKENLAIAESDYSSNPSQENSLKLEAARNEANQMDTGIVPTPGFKMSFSKDGTITISSPTGRINVEANDITMTASQNFTVNAENSIKISSGNQTNIYSAGKSNLVGEVGALIFGGGKGDLYP